MSDIEKLVWIQFQINANTILGEEIFIVGSCPELGNWDPNKAIKLSTSGDKYPLWISQDIQIFLSAKKAKVEYKYIKKLNGNVLWEMGRNRSLPEVLDKYLKKIKAADFRFCHNIEKRYGSYGLIFYDEEGKGNNFEYYFEERPNVRKLCPYHKNNEEIIYMTSFEDNLSFFVTKTHQNVFICNNERFLGINKDKIYTLHKNYNHSTENEMTSGIKENKIDYGNGKYYSRNIWFDKKNQIYFNSKFAFTSNGNYGYCTNKISYIKIFMDGGDKSFELPSKNNNYDWQSIHTKIVFDRYLFYIDNKFILRLDILDEESGWELIYTFKNVELPEWTGSVIYEFLSPNELIMYLRNQGVLQLIDLIKSKENLHVKKKNILPDQFRRYSFYKCTKHNVIFFWENSICHTLTLYGYDFTKNCSLIENFSIPIYDNHRFYLN